MDAKLLRFQHTYSKIGTDLHTYLTEIFISLESLAECQNVGTKTETHIGTC